MQEREIKVGWVDGDKVKVVKYKAGVGLRGTGEKERSGYRGGVEGDRGEREKWI